MPTQLLNDGDFKLGLNTLATISTLVNWCLGECVVFGCKKNDEQKRNRCLHHRSLEVSLACCRALSSISR